MASDIDFLGLVPSEGAGRFSFRVRNHLSRMDGQLYGGSAIAASIATAELISERTALWMTTQFVATAPAESIVEVHAEVLALGNRTNQVRVTGTDSTGRIMFASLGATGHPRPDGLVGTFEHPPVVSSPEDSRDQSGPFATMVRNAGVEGPVPEIPARLGFNSVVEFREPVVQHHPDPGPGRICVWVRRRDGVPVTPTTVAFMADMIPMSVAHGCGVVAGGLSLDNTIRLGTFEESDWVLVDMRGHLASGDYGHGSAFVWSRSGRLLAIASQSASMFEFDLADAPWNQKS